MGLSISHTLMPAIVTYCVFSNSSRSTALKLRTSLFSNQSLLVADACANTLKNSSYQWSFFCSVIFYKHKSGCHFSSHATHIHNGLVGCSILMVEYWYLWIIHKPQGCTVWNSLVLKSLTFTNMRQLHIFHSSTFRCSRLRGGVKSIRCRPKYYPFNYQWDHFLFSMLLYPV